MALDTELRCEVIAFGDGFFLVKGETEEDDESFGPFEVCGLGDLTGNAFGLITSEPAQSSKKLETRVSEIELM